MSIIGVSGKIGSGKDTVGRIIQYLTTNVRHSYSFKDWVKDDISNSNSWQIVKFADKLKDCVCLILGCTREQLEDIDFKNSTLPECWTRYAKLVDHNFNDLNKIVPNPYTVREFLQKFSTEVGRSLHENTWINATMNNYNDGSKIHIGANIYITEEEFRKNTTVLANTNHSVDELVESNRLISNWIITDVRFPNELKAIKDRDGITIRVNRLTSQQLKSDIPPHSSETALDDATFDYTIDNNGSIEDLIEQVKQILIKEHII
jgi:hypothetical protein